MFWGGGVAQGLLDQMLRRKLLLARPARCLGWFTSSGVGSLPLEFM